MISARHAAKIIVNADASRRFVRVIGAANDLWITAEYVDLTTGRTLTTMISAGAIRRERRAIAA